MRNLILAAAMTIAAGCGDAATVTHSSVGGGADTLNLAPIPVVDPERELLRDIFFAQTPEDIIVVLPEKVAEVVEPVMESKWERPRTLSGGKAPNGKVETGTLSVGSSSIKGGDVEVAEAAPLTKRADDPTIIREVLRRNAGQVSYCHNVAKSRYSDVAGRIEVRWSINAGQVEDIQVVSNSTGDERMAVCVLSKVTRMEFPEDMTVATVDHPFVFQKG